jgi:hypothetical protein
MDKQIFIEVALAVLLVMFGVAPWVLPRIDERTRPGAGYHKAWSHLAARAGLVFERGTEFASGRVLGTYRGRTLSLSLEAGGRLTARLRTHIRMSLRQPLAGWLSAWRLGPAGWLWQRLARRSDGRGAPLRFALRSEPPHLAERLLMSPALCRKLAQAGPMRLQAHGSLLTLQHDGAVMDVEYLLFLFDLLNDIARLVERD